LGRARFCDAQDKTPVQAKVAERFGFAQQLELPMPMPIVQKEEAAN
jgi:hypothetical protein